jgi:murein DD-endopeptidase
MKPTRSDFLFTALGYLGIPYRWGGKHPDKDGGLDCSGLVTHVLWELNGADWRYTHNTDRLWDELRETDDPQPGDLAFYGIGGVRPNPSHVMLWLGACGLVFGASGGDSSTTSLAAATKRNARVKFKSSVHYRPDFIGFRSMPLS